MPLPLTAPAPAADDPTVKPTPEDTEDTNLVSFAVTQLQLLRLRCKQGQSLECVQQDVEDTIFEALDTLAREAKERRARVDALTQAIGEGAATLISVYAQLKSAELRAGTHLGFYLTETAKQTLREQLGPECVAAVDKRIADTYAAKAGGL